MPQIEKCLSSSVMELFLLRKFDNRSSIITQDRDLSGDYELIDICFGNLGQAKIHPIW